MWETWWVKINNKLLWLCLSAVVLTPLSNDMFISGFPEMSVFFSTSHIGLLISFYLIGIASAQLFYGPLLDRYGRRPVLVIGLFIYLIGNGLMLTTSNFPLFLFARFIQAIGVCSTIGTSLAILHDTRQGHAFVASMGVLSAVIGICPAISPFFGSILTTHFGWKSNFYVLFGLGCFYFLVIAIFFRETQESKNLLATSRAHIWGNYRSLCGRKAFRLYCLVSALTYGVLFSYVTVAAPFIITSFKMPIMTVGWVALILGALIFLCSLLVPKVVKVIGLPKMALIGVITLTCGAVLMLVCNIIFGPGFYTFVGPMLVVIIGVGIVRPVVAVGAMQTIEKNLSGSASAGFNFTLFVGGAFFSGIAAHYSHHVMDFVILIVVASLLALVAAIRNYRQEGAACLE